MVAMSPMWLLSTQSEGSIEELIFYFILFNFKIKWPPVASVDNIGRLWCKEPPFFPNKYCTMIETQG